MKNKLSLIMLVIISLMMVLGCRWFSSKDNGKIDIDIKPSDGKETKSENSNAREVSATELFKAYKDDKTKADSAYKDKTLLVSGVIDVVGKDLASGSTFVSLKPSDSRYNAAAEQVQIFFKPSESTKISSLKEGQSIKVLGRCAGKTGNIVIREGILQ